MGDKSFVGQYKNENDGGCPIAERRGDQTAGRDQADDQHHGYLQQRTPVMGGNIAAIPLAPVEHLSDVEHDEGKSHPVDNIGDAVNKKGGSGTDTDGCATVPQCH
jgi:hypothetical protein